MDVLVFSSFYGQNVATICTKIAHIKSSVLVFGGFPKIVKITSDIWTVTASPMRTPKGETRLGESGKLIRINSLKT